MQRWWQAATLVAWLSASGLGLAAEQAATKPLTLNDAIGLALGFEPLVEEARIAKEQARLALLRAQLDRVSLRIDGTIQELYLSEVGGPFRDPQTGELRDPSNLRAFSRGAARLDVPIFAGFGVQANVDRARALDRSAAEALEAERRATAVGVARVYWNIQRLYAAQDAIKRALERLEVAQRVARARERSGLTAPIDANRVLARRTQQEADRVALEGQLQGSLAELAVLLGVPGPLMLATPSFDRAAPQDVADEWVARGLGSRPELASLRHQVEAANQSVRVARAPWFPQLAAYGQYEYSNTQRYAGAGNQQLLDPGTGGLPSDSLSPFVGLSSYAQAGLVLSWNVFDTFKTYTAAKDASYQAARTEARLRDAQQEVEREIRRVHARRDQLWNQLEVLERAEALARDNVDILRKRYENGDALVLELLESEVELLQTERQRSEIQADIQLAELELEAASGKILGAESPR